MPHTDHAGRSDGFAVAVSGSDGQLAAACRQAFGCFLTRGSTVEAGVQIVTGAFEPDSGDSFRQDSIYWLRRNYFRGNPRLYQLAQLGQNKFLHSFGVCRGCSP